MVVKYLSKSRVLIVIGFILTLFLIISGVSAATNVSSCLTIGFQGTYVFNQSFSGSGNCITIISSDVVLDGAGFTLEGTGSGNGVYVWEFGTTFTNVTVRNLVVTDWSNGIWYRGSQDGRIENNNASSNFRGIQLSDSSNNNILTNNTANLNNAGSQSDGIRITSSNNNILTNNNVSSNYNGIWITSSSTSNSVAGNNVSSNQFGIRISSANSNTISNNTVTSNSQHALYLVNSNNNILKGNIAENNLRGITVVAPASPSANNKIYNNFFNNTGSPLITTSLANTWNTAKTLGTNIIGGSYLGGNFWGTPAGTGFSQTCTDTSPADGLCDSSYVLAAGNVDNLPLAMPAAPPTTSTTTTSTTTTTTTSTTTTSTTTSTTTTTTTTSTTTTTTSSTSTSTSTTTTTSSSTTTTTKPATRGGGRSRPVEISSRENALLVANSVDYALASDFLSYIKQNKIEWNLTHPSGLSQEMMVNNRLIIILGGPDAYDGVGDIVKEVLSDAEEEAVRQSGSQRMFVKFNVWTDMWSHKQIVIIIAGSNRDGTNKASETYREDVKELLNP
jgi:parallel beta-helix repeat protein